MQLISAVISVLLLDCKASSMIFLGVLLPRVCPHSAFLFFYNTKRVSVWYVQHVSYDFCKSWIFHPILLLGFKWFLEVKDFTCKQCSFKTTMTLWSWSNFFSLPFFFSQYYTIYIINKTFSLYFNLLEICYCWRLF